MTVRWYRASQGRTVSFRNCVVIMTSNIGSADILANARSSGSAASDGLTAATELRVHDLVMSQVTGLTTFSRVPLLYRNLPGDVPID